MMRLKTYPIFLLLLSLGVQGLSQNSGLSWNALNETSNRLKGKIRGETFYITSTSNQFFFLQRDWADGQIELTDGDIYDNVKMRYYAFGDELVAYNDRIRSLFIVDKDIVKRFSYKELLNGGGFKEREFIKLQEEKENKGERFYEKLFSGARMLLAFHYVNESKVRPYTDKLGAMRDTEYKLETYYYMYDLKNGMIKIQPKQRSITKAFPEHKKEIKKIIRQNKIVVRSQTSLIQTFILLDNAGLLN